LKVWRVKEMRKRDKIVEIQKPTNEELYFAREKIG
jgi:hypothetical protein